MSSSTSSSHAAEAPQDAGAHPWTREMAMIHRIFRRESRLLSDLVQKVTVGDTARAAVLATTLRAYAAGLHLHHSGEDEFLWPVLRPHVADDATLVALMEEQHTRLADELREMDRLLDAWTVAAGAPERDALASLLRRHHRTVRAHLDQEEREVMPLVVRHVEEAVWQAMGEAGLRRAPRDRRLMALGAILEDATEEERQAFLGRLPVAARLAWRLVGRRQYRRRMDAVRDTGHRG
jgi:hemerythrin-like domain-containing protein